tara:strand:+ start:1819 stop:2262 length:444 start_codon:yes stop_codon:yes gene_type:complete
MPLPIERACWGKLEQISQLVGQINGMAYGCRRWNVPAMQGLDIELDALMKSTFCRPASVGADSPAYDALLEMQLTNQLTLEAFGMNPEGWDELAKEEVGRVAANAVVGVLQSYWLTALNDIHKWYAENDFTHTNGHSDTRPIPEAVR